MTPVQKRRRDVLLVLGAAVAATLLLALVVTSPVLWVVQVLADLLLVAYVFLLVQVKQRAAMGRASGIRSPARPSRPSFSLRHPEPPARPELELAPVPEFALHRTASR